MVFSSPIFLFLFLPITLAIHALLPGTRAKNVWLLAVSLLFYIWGETNFIFLLLGSTLINYLIGRWMERTEDEKPRKSLVALAIILNIGLLCLFKYAAFFVQGLNAVLAIAHLPSINPPQLTLPIGISFFTFHAVSYVMDIYRKKWTGARGPLDTALYIFFFPQLVAGPILRWSAIGPQLERHPMSVEMFSDGVRRFVGGLTKKILIANTLAKPADQIFSLPTAELSGPVAWLGAVCYTLQIYFDFSGYSDMAVGLGKMFGFHFIENFQFPYTAQSIKDFWRRWHISLSSWFRDYLYIPLGGNRVSNARTHLNLLIVFLLCGLWHGASLTFVAWGVYHGVFLVLERTWFGKFQERLPQVFQHIYTLLAVMFGWVLFRADSIAGAGQYYVTLLGLGKATAAQPLSRYVTREVIFALIFGIPFSLPLVDSARARWKQINEGIPARFRSLAHLSTAVVELVLIASLLIVSSAWLARGTYNPFIYFRF